MWRCVRKWQIKGCTGLSCDIVWGENGFLVVGTNPFDVYEGLKNKSVFLHFFPFIIIFPFNLKFKKTTFNNKSINNMKKYYKYICFKSCSWCASILCIGLLSAICHRKKGSDSLRKNTPKNTQFFTVKFLGSINDILKPTAYLENPLSTKNN